jgi:ribosomal protein L16 Arg81 hydroxylase/predicted enzyme related to lactoylglutathione lyase
VSAELQDLLDPVTPEEFLAEYWERRSLHVPGPADKFHGLFSRSAFDRAVANHERDGIYLRVSFDHEREPHRVSVHLPVRAEEIDHYLEQGASVCADPIDRGDVALAEYAARVARQLHFTGRYSVKAYLSADGCGFNTHFDKGIATTLQIEGRKRWRYSTGPAVPFPRGNALLGPDGRARYVGRLPSSLDGWEHVEGVDEGQFEEVVLEPGHLLCLPAGTWHNAKAIGHSLALNLSFQPVDFLSFLATALRPMLDADPRWRRSLPAVIEAAGDGLPAPVAGFVADRLEELRGLLARLDTRDDRLGGHWRNAVAAAAASAPAAAAGSAPRRAPAPAAASPGEPRATAPAAIAPAAAAGDDGSPPPGGWRTAAGAAAGTPPGGGLPRYDGRMVCTLCVHRLEAAIEWYESVLGLRVVYRSDAFGWCELATAVAGVSVGLSEVEEVVTGGTTLTLGVEHLDELRHEMEAKGVRFDGPTQVLQGMVKLAPFFDPHGNRLVLSEEA